MAPMRQLGKFLSLFQLAVSSSPTLFGCLDELKDGTVVLVLRTVMY